MNPASRPYFLTFLFSAALVLPAFAEPLPTDGPSERAYTVGVLTRIADPVLNALADNKLHQSMPVEGDAKRRPVTHLEAFARLLSGMAPWLELGPDETPEGKLRAHYIELALKCIHNATDPKEADYLNFKVDGPNKQPLCDASYLALAMLRAPTQLWAKLNAADQAHVIAAWKSAGIPSPNNNNWVLFSSTVQVALWKFTGQCDKSQIETAISKINEWYKGDGTYGDGPFLQWDYYNSYVMHPMMLADLQVCVDENDPLGKNYGQALLRARRYALIQERMISPEAAYPVIGRSSAYRFGAFQELSLMALLHQLPEPLKPGGVRAALTAVIHRVIEEQGTFDSAGWLRIGAVGHQPSIADSYVSTGSLYICANGLLHLGLPANDPFWTDPDASWTQKTIWSGQDIKPDHGMK